MGRISTKLHRFLTSIFRYFVRTDVHTDRQTPPKTVPARSIAGAQVINFFAYSVYKNVCCVQGATGDVGAIGEQGDRGPIGSVGAMGVKGPRGPIGDMGFENSVKGEVGVVGMNGSQGENGATGTQGLQGQVGEEGPQGFPGSNYTVVLYGPYRYHPETGDG